MVDRTKTVRVERLRGEQRKLNAFKVRNSGKNDEESIKHVTL